MNKLTNEQIQAILDGAPEGATHYDIDGEGYIQVTNLSIFDYIKGRMVNGGYLEVDRNLTDLREILELRQEVKRLKAQQSEVAARAVEEILNWDHSYIQTEEGILPCSQKNLLTTTS